MAQNIITWLIVALAIAYFAKRIYDRNRGNGCDCGCGGCSCNKKDPNACQCHSQQNATDD